MKTVTFTDFRKNASGLISEVEHGEVLVIIRHGKPIAEVSPIASQDSLPAWKQPALRLSAKGAELSAAIAKDRSDEDLF